jgi:hypothetical protein
MTHLLEANQFLDQLDLVVENRGSAKGVLVKNGPTPEDDCDEEDTGDLGGVQDELDAFADEGTGDY